MSDSASFLGGLESLLEQIFGRNVADPGIAISEARARRCSSSASDSLRTSSFHPVKPGREPDVLALLADRERELVVGDDDLHARDRLRP